MPDGDEHAAPIVASARGAAKIWNEIFGGIDVSERDQRDIRQFTFATLTGMASAKRLQSGRAGERAQLDLLKKALCALFESSAAKQDPGRKPGARSA